MASILLSLGVLLLPVLLPTILFGLAGSNPEHFLFIGAGYLVFLGSAFIGIWKKKFLYGCLLGILIAFIGIQLSDNFWKKHNEDLCQELRSDIYCIETALGFNCVEPSNLGNMSTSSGICKIALSSEQRDNENKRKRLEQLAEAKQKGRNPPKKIPDNSKVMKALDRYDVIVRTILSSPEPQNLDFEKDLTSIYNCINDEYENILKAELFTTNRLGVLIKTPEEKERYAVYSSSKGRHLTPSVVVAGLPAGDKSLGCDTIMHETNP